MISEYKIHESNNLYEIALFIKHLFGTLNVISQIHY